jgi:polyhydroxybutyrate depolymerase
MTRLTGRLQETGAGLRLAVALLVVTVIAVSTCAHFRGAVIGRGEETVRVGGLRRTFVLHVPPAVAGTQRRVPLVLAFHGRGGTGRAMQRLSKLDGVADRNGFVVVYPDGIRRSWNAGTGAGAAERRGVDDVAFAAAVIDAVAARYPVDRRRVYATGMSNGGSFVQRLGCELAPEVAAIAPVAGGMAPDVMAHCTPARPVAVVMFQGLQDELNPAGGGKTAGGGEVEPAQVALRTWAARDRCRDLPAHEQPAPGVVLTVYRRCARRTAVALYTIGGGGHTWPGGAAPLPSVIVGNTPARPSASNVMWRFFETSAAP